MFTFRIYQLGEDDIQQPAQNFTGALGEATSGGAGDEDFDYLFSITGGRGPKAEKTEAGPSAALGGALSRAYLIFCTINVITNRIDLCADGPLNLVSLEITGFPLHDAEKVYGIAAVGPDAVATTCDSGLHAVADLTYFGRGSVEVAWRVGDVIIGKSRIDGLSSPPRQNLGKGEQSDCANAIKAVLKVKSPPLPVQELGQYAVRAEARVVFGFTDPNLGATSLSALKSHQAKSGNPSSEAWLNSLKGGQAPQVGLINSGSGPGSFGYLNDIQPSALTPLSAAALNQPPLAVVSGPKIYEVKAADPKQLCRVWIPTPDGRFEVSDLQNNVQKEAAGFKGQGMLHLPLSRSSDANETYLVPVQFSGWQVDEASGDLKNGALDFSPGLSILPPGTKGTLDRIAVKVTNGKGTPLQTTMSLGFRDQALRLPGEVETPPQFPKLSSSLTAEGDWLKENVALPEILIGWSAFRVKSPAMAFDFHKKKGALPAGECSNGEVSWVGVNLGQATIIPYTFDMVGKTPYVLQVNNWGIVDKGMCGKLAGGPFHADYQEGWLEFGGLIFSAANASYVVQYKNLVVHVPWVGTDLKGDATFKKFEGGYGIDLGAVTGQAPPLDYGQFVLKPQQLSFLSEKNLGWVVGSVAPCEFNADGKPFAKLTFAHLFFGFDGRAYFEEGSTSKTFSLGGHSSLGATPLDLVNVDITAPSKGTGRLDFAFHTKLHLSENPVIPAADVQINYNIFRSGATYQGTGPTNNPFTCEIAFPVGNPVMTAQIRPEYFPAGSSPGKEADPGPAAGPSLDEPPPSQDTRWYGDLDMALFGGPEVKAQLLIGYRSGKSYFLMRADYPLGPTGIPFSPLPFSLFRLSGALGYNFPVDAFKNVSTTSIADAEPDLGGDTLFMAGMRIGSSDKFAFTLDGTFTVSTAGAARMDYGAWILQVPSGTANFQGYFKYGGGNFDGRLWGRLSFFNDLILFDLGTSESDAAVDLHFGSGNWHIYAGQKDGARIKATVLFGGGSDAYLMLGSDVGLALGGAYNMTFADVGVSSIASAYVKGYMDIGLQVTPQPKVVGDFGAGASAGACAFEVCVSASVNAQVHVEAFPIDAYASAELDLPWPLPSVSFTVHL